MDAGCGYIYFCILGRGYADVGPLLTRRHYLSSFTTMLQWLPGNVQAPDLLSVLQRVYEYNPYSLVMNALDASDDQYDEVDALVRNYHRVWCLAEDGTY